MIYRKELWTCMIITRNTTRQFDCDLDTFYFKLSTIMFCNLEGAIVVMIVLVTGFTTSCAISVYHNVSLNAAHDKVYSIQQARITQWHNTEFIYAEILNKTSLALIFMSDIFIIFFIYYQVVYMLYFVLFRCVTGFLSHFCSWPGQIIYFLKKRNTFQIPLRIKWPSPKRYIGRSRRVHSLVPFFVLDYRHIEICQTVGPDR